MTEPVLVAEGLAFSYGRFRRRRIFSDFDWAVAPGQVTMLLGPNGAGKSTLLKLLSGFETPDAGRVTVNGRAGRRAMYERVGWMPQDVQPARGLSVEEQVEFAAWVGGATRRDARAAAREALRAVDLEPESDVRTARLSGGQLRRVGLAQALVRRAPVLLLDEPLVGLDPAQASNFRGLLSGLDCPGGVVISTHQVEDLVDDVDRVAVLADGRLKFDGTVAEMRGRASSVTEAFTGLVGGGRH